MAGSIVRSPWTWAALAAGLGYYAWVEHSQVQAARAVAWQAQLAQAELQRKVDAAGMVSDADTVRKMASAWWASFTANTTTQDVMTFLHSLDTKWIPLVLDTWRQDGMSLALLTDLAKGFGIIQS